MTPESAIPALAYGNVAVITGAASGIGFAVARKFASMGLRVVIADRESPVLHSALAELVAIALGGPEDVIAIPCDVSRPEDLDRLADQANTQFGDVSFVMNNAGVGSNPGKPWENLEDWKALVEINFWGVVHGVQAFAPGMLSSGKPGLIVNTGSKQGITTPPGNLAYNVSKSAVRTYTEGLAHALRNEPGSKVAAHLLIPGFTFTGMTTGARQKPAGAWTPDQVVSFMLTSLARNDFYILCPDNETDRSTDERRMAWAIGDIIENRPALSRWHPDYSQAFADYLKKK
ncbi:short-chain dehydrogenase [Mesorhizobium sp. L-8-10]|uniref:SDR family NAD(P)-dependent oxidoreductase n=1 Tax=unclassified Mesorhizobium TaxID=325217 RepID=UPI001927B4EB|nr:MULTISPECIES: SDR family NAD(P)-dependent oxidoreductase [unclassified Mesorhizobium]BCH24148.1 short-chain dehydrogenase [Mesorhizobium sp. L-8-3]BCH31882.1 short-chain dehydrogenase [Mesorhizobium sp. L-8-10]